MSIVELEALGEFVVENHGGYYSDGQWVSGVIKAVDNSIAGRWPTSVIFVSNARQQVAHEAPNPTVLMLRVTRLASTLCA